MWLGSITGTLFYEFILFNAIFPNLFLVDKQLTTYFITNNYSGTELEDLPLEKDGDYELGAKIDGIQLGSSLPLQNEL